MSRGNLKNKDYLKKKKKKVALYALHKCGCYQIMENIFRKKKKSYKEASPLGNNLKESVLQRSRVGSILQILIIFFLSLTNVAMVDGLLCFIVL